MKYSRTVLEPYFRELSCDLKVETQTLSIFENISLKSSQTPITLSWYKIVWAIDSYTSFMIQECTK